eukprot:scaffold13_cov100-Skeletonema_marinoi.AAC.1
MEMIIITANKEVLLGSLPHDCRRNILSYICPTELYASYAATSRLCHSDSLDAQLPQTKFGEFHVTGRGETEINMESLLERISHASFLNAWQSPRSHMKIVSHERDGAVVTTKVDDLTFEEMQVQASSLSFGSITSLDLSVSHCKHGGELNRVLPRGITWLLSTMMPNLVKLDLSNLHGGPIKEGDSISELALFNATNCPNLSKVVWNNRIGGGYFLRGRDLKTLTNLRELWADNLLCDWRYDKLFAPLLSQFFDENSIIQRFFFFACNEKLERVSLLGGRYVKIGTNDAIKFPQMSLIRFVRNTPQLRWFRSDLAEENVRMLSEERPEITFVAS